MILRDILKLRWGSARLMGVKLTQNFDRPLSSTSFTEFFRRWHITLNVWFTEYVYIPLGGNRKGMPRKLLNTLIVFALCGIWHGANWTFVFGESRSAYSSVSRRCFESPFAGRVKSCILT